MEKLNNHKVKINFSNAVFAKTTYTFLSYEISESFVAPDSKRINKLLQAGIPKKNRYAHI